MKAAILKLLRQKAATCSGEELSEALGISRVAVWKHIRRLRELGYDITATPQGYRLDHSPDTPFAWEFPHRQGLIHYHPSVDSTMNGARDLARQDCPAMSVVVSGEQTSGKGRMARQWVSAPQGLYFTVVTRPDLAPPLAPRVGFAAAVSLARVFRDEYSVAARVKWPNDVLTDQGKLAGMLAEMETDGEWVRHVNVGIGVNVNHHPEIAETAATSLKAETGGPVSRKQVLDLFLTAFETRLEQIHAPSIMEEWKELNQTLGKQVKIVTRTATLQGLALDVDDSGALVLETSGGDQRLVHYGDCFPLPA